MIELNRQSLEEAQYPSGWVFGGAMLALVALFYGLWTATLSTFFDAVVMAMLFLVIMGWVGVRMARDVDRSWLPKMVAAGFIAKMFWSLVRYGVLEIIYHGSGDAVGYHGSGHVFAEVWRSFQVPEGFAVGTAFMDRLTGLLYVPYIPSMLGGFFLFSTLAFIGQLLMYAAFRETTKPRRLKWYALVIFFIPAISYWPASIGKESIMFLSIGLAVYGAARLLNRGGVRSIVIMTAGLALGGAIRPHVSALIVASLAGALVLAKSKGGGLSLSPFMRFMAIVIVGGGSLFLITFAAQEFNIDLQAGDIGAEFDEFVSTVEDNTAKGGSEVSGGMITNPLDLPDAALRVLFRPLPYEAHNLQAMASALESSTILLIILWRTPAMWRNRKRIREDGYVLMSMIMTLGFVIMFSPFLNLGLMTRERSMILPILAAWVIALGWDAVKEKVEEPPAPPVRPTLRVPV